MKSSHVTIAAKRDIVQEGEVGGSLYTLYEGWAARYQRLPDGARQIFDILLPGDMIGLDSVMFATATYSVQAITPVSLCVLGGRSMTELVTHNPGLAMAILRTRVEEEQRADVRLALLGRRSAVQRVGYLMLDLYDRLTRRGLVNGGTTCPFPLTRRHLADATGLSTMHLTRTLGQLREKRLAVIEGAVLVLYDWKGLAEIAGYVPVADRPNERAIL
jgi:CRP-like cAMP-binding protein